jgi:hypothetical protein
VYEGNPGRLPRTTPEWWIWMLEAVESHQTDAPLFPLPRPIREFLVLRMPARGAYPPWLCRKMCSRKP